MTYEPRAPITVTREQADQENARWLISRKNHQVGTHARVCRLAENALYVVGEQREVLKKNLRIVRAIGEEIEGQLTELDTIARSIAMDAKAAGVVYVRPDLLEPRRPAA